MVGRTCWLRVPYRMARQIYLAAYALVAENLLALQLLGADGECVAPDAGSELLSDGPRPEGHSFAVWGAEQDFVQDKIGDLVQAGERPAEIGVVNEQRHVLEKYRQIVPRAVRVLELEKQTGMEYQALFIPRIHDLIDRQVGIAAAEDEARQRLYLLSGPRWPSIRGPARPYADLSPH